MTFSSGVVKEYKVDSVEVLKDAAVKVTRRGDGYVVEAAVHLTALGLKPGAPLSLRGDFGVTYGDAAGQRTRLHQQGLEVCRAVAVVGFQARDLRFGLGAAPAQQAKQVLVFFRVVQAVGVGLQVLEHRDHRRRLVRRTARL